MPGYKIHGVEKGTREHNIVVLILAIISKSVVEQPEYGKTCMDGTRLADEAVDVPRPAHGVDRLVRDGLRAALALGAGGVDVALLAVRVAVEVVEPGLGREAGPARPAREAAPVPRLLHGPNAPLQIDLDL